jgi:hypothetical protein
MKKTLSYALVALSTICTGVSLLRANKRLNAGTRLGSQTCPSNDSGLKLPPGFCATVFADNIGHARHMVATPNGVLYINTWSGRYYGNDTPHAGGFLVGLQDKTGSGKADVIERFGETIQTGGHGGTGIGMYRGAIYAEINDRIARYRYRADLSHPAALPRLSFRDCLWVATIRCTHSSLAPTARCMSTSQARPIPARARTERLDRQVRTHARNLRRAVGFGAMTRRR